MKKSLLFILLIFGIKKYNAQLCYFSSPTIAVSNASAMTAGDFNNDGNQDLAISNNPNGLLSIYLGNGAGSFSLNSSISNSQWIRSVKTIDLNNDGNLDLVYLRSFGNAYVAHGLGNGSFTVAPGSYAGCSDPLSVLTSDFNNDSKQDLIITDYCSVFLNGYFGVNGGVFGGVMSNFIGISNQAYDATVADFDNDGNKDLVVPSAFTNKVYFLKGLGTGSFAAAVNYTVGTGPQGITSGDYNGDGSVDIAVSLSGSDSVAVMLGSSNATFAQAVFYKVGMQPKGIFSRDMNADGKLDLVVLNTGVSTNSVSILLNNNGVFSPAINYPVGLMPINVSVADFNNDNHPDFITSNSGANSLSVWLSSFPVVSGNSVVCEGNPLTFTATAPIAGTLAWSNGSTNSVTAFTPTLNGTYTVSVGNTINGCTSSSIKTINVLPAPGLTVSSTRSVLCLGETATISIVGANSYSWSVGSTASFVVTHPSTNYTYTITGTGSNGCSKLVAFTQSVVSCTGLNSTSNTMPLGYISPNPGNGSFKLQNYESSGNVKIEVYNSLGQNCSDRILQNNLSVNLTGLPDGIYFFRILDNNRLINIHKVVLVN